MDRKAVRQALSVLGACLASPPSLASPQPANPAQREAASQPTGADRQDGSAPRELTRERGMTVLDYQVILFPG